jgi:hypothetical protein
LENYLFIRVKHDKSVEEHEGAVGMRDLLLFGAKKIIIRRKNGFSRDRHGKKEEKRNQEKCENKAIS